MCEQITKYFANLSIEQIEQFAMLGRLYTSWNNQINVISRKDISRLYERHVLHSLAIAKIISFADNAKVLDVGTGGGFPGIPLSILFPKTNFYLVDSIGKKLKVAQSVASALNLKNVRCEHARVEDIKGKYDFIVSRAVTSLSTFIPWMSGKLHKNSKMFFLKGGDLTEEIQPYIHKAKIYNISDFFDEEYFLEKKIVCL